jgi:hypothetical protein
LYKPKNAADRIFPHGHTHLARRVNHVFVLEGCHSLIDHAVLRQRNGERTHMDLPPDLQLPDPPAAEDHGWSAAPASGAHAT